MKAKAREVTKTEIVYEITKEELEEIKREAGVELRRRIASYMWFCHNNFIFGRSLTWEQLCQLLYEVLDFVCGKTNYISNTYKYSFDDYVRAKIDGEI